MPDSPLQPTTGVSRQTALLVMVSVCVAALWPTVLCDFSGWDDEQFLARNPFLANPQWAGVWHYWLNPHYRIYAPLTFSVWVALAAVGRSQTPDELGVVLNPYVFHAANLLVHLMAAWLAFLVLERLLQKRWPALLGALAFAVHPVQVESVAWASGLKDVLAGLGVLGAILLYLDAHTATGRPRQVKYVACVLVALLAMLAKPSAMTVVLLLAAIDLLWLGRPIRATAIRLLPFVVLAIAVAIVARMVQPPAGELPDPPLWARPLIVGHTLAFYLYKLLWPAKLGFDYGNNPELLLQDGRWVYWAWLVPLACFAWAAWMWRRTRLPMLAVALFVLAPLPTLGFVPFDFQLYSTSADHYLYVSMLGVGLLIGWAAGRLPPRAAAVVGVALVIAWSVRSYRQAWTWQTTETFTANTLAVNPQSFGGHTSAAVYAMRQRDLPLAIAHASTAIEIRPTFWRAHAVRGAARATGNDLAGAEADYRTVIRLAPDEPEGLVNLGGLLAHRGQLEEARTLLQRAADLDPTNAQAALNYGSLLMQTGDFPSAERFLGRAVRLQPHDVRTRVRYARVLLALNRNEDAVAELRAAHALSPHDAELRQVMSALQPGR